MEMEFIEIIESVTPDPNLLMWKFRDEDKEIKNGAQLTVRESQRVMLLCEGRVADVFGPGVHTLSTDNIPILSKLRGWKYGFKSPYKADVYFFNTHLFINNKWGTPTPILINDPGFGNIRIRAFGSFDLEISDVARFFSRYAGTYGRLTIFELQQQLRDVIAPKFGEILATEKIPLMETAGSMSALSEKVTPLLTPYFEQLGVRLTRFVITSVTLPDEVTAHFDNISSMNMVDDMNRYTAFQTAQAIGDKNGGLRAAAQQGAMMGLVVNHLQSADAGGLANGETLETKLRKLKDLFEKGLIDAEEYKAKKSHLLAEFG
ncbi:MAG: SPFH domain-containing protein [Clostridiales Family XIII bacterium]|jgi:membrane protease subunit (stomatin/prohibitin family)|nr:SPFH domain-containing protein [Clostridiales Family XIII bacterium]